MRVLVYLPIALLPFSVFGCDSSKDDTGSDDTGSDTGDTDDTGDTSDSGMDTADTGTDTGDTGGGDPTARVRVLHLSPDAPAVDVFVEGVADPVVTDLAFAQGTPYLDVPATSYTFQVAPAGAGVGSTVLTIADLTLAAGMDYTAVAFDTVGSIRAAALVDDASGLAEGSFRVHVMHAAPAVGVVDIWALTDDGASPLLTDVPFAGAASLDLPAGAYRVGFDVNDDASPDVTFSLPELPGGLYVNLFATNDAGGNVFLLAQLPDGTVARVDAD